MELSVLFSGSKLSGCVFPKETREGWPLLTVETEVNGDSKRTNEKWSCLGWFVKLVSPVQNSFVLPCCSSQPSILTVHYFNSFVPIAQQAGQAAVLGRLSLGVCVSGNGSQRMREKHVYIPVLVPREISFSDPATRLSIITRTIGPVSCCQASHLSLGWHIRMYWPAVCCSCQYCI